MQNYRVMGGYKEHRFCWFEEPVLPTPEGQGGVQKEGEKGKAKKEEEKQKGEKATEEEAVAEKELDTKKATDERVSQADNEEIQRLQQEIKALEKKKQLGDLRRKKAALERELGEAKTPSAEEKSLQTKETVKIEQKETSPRKEGKEQKEQRKGIDWDKVVKGSTIWKEEKLQEKPKIVTVAQTPDNRAERLEDRNGFAIDREWGPLRDTVFALRRENRELRLALGIKQETNIPQSPLEQYGTHSHIYRQFYHLRDTAVALRQDNNMRRKELKAKLSSSGQGENAQERETKGVRRGIDGTVTREATQTKTDQTPEVDKPVEEKKSSGTTQVIERPRETAESASGNITALAQRWNERKVEIVKKAEERNIPNWRTKFLVPYEATVAHMRERGDASLGELLKQTLELLDRWERILGINSYITDADRAIAIFVEVKQRASGTYVWLHWQQEDMHNLYTFNPADGVIYRKPMDEEKKPHCLKNLTWQEVSLEKLPRLPGWATVKEYSVNGKNIKRVGKMMGDEGKEIGGFTESGLSENDYLDYLKKHIKSKETFIVYEQAFLDYYHPHHPDGPPEGIIPAIREHGKTLLGVTKMIQEIKDKYGVKVLTEEKTPSQKYKYSIILPPVSSLPYPLASIQRFLARYPKEFRDAIKLERITIGQTIHPLGWADSSYIVLNQRADEGLRVHEMHHVSDASDGMRDDNASWPNGVYALWLEDPLWIDDLYSPIGKNIMPPGYASQYGYERSDDECQAEVARRLLEDSKSYNTFMDEASNPITEQKIRIIKKDYERKSQNLMNDKFWEDWATGMMDHFTAEEWEAYWKKRREE